MTPARPLLSEFVATGLLLAIVIGSGIMGERLAGGNDAITLLANTLATVGGLYFLIEVFGPVSGAIPPQPAATPDRSMAAAPPATPPAGAPLPDPCTIAWLLKPDLFSTVERWVGVETQGKYTQGMTVVDYYFLTGNKPNATVMVDVDRQGFVDLLAERLTFYSAV